MNIHIAWDILKNTLFIWNWNLAWDLYFYLLNHTTLTTYPSHFFFHQENSCCTLWTVGTCWLYFTDNPGNPQILQICHRGLFPGEHCFCSSSEIHPTYCIRECFCWKKSSREHDTNWPSSWTLGKQKTPPLLCPWNVCSATVPALAAISRRQPWESSVLLRSSGLNMWLNPS